MSKLPLQNFKGLKPEKTRVILKYIPFFDQQDLNFFKIHIFKLIGNEPTPGDVEHSLARVFRIPSQQLD